MRRRAPLLFLSPLLWVHCASTEPPPAAAPTPVAVVLPLEPAAPTPADTPVPVEPAPDAAPAASTPLFRPRSAVAFPGTDNDSMFDGARIVLFASEVGCEEATSSEATHGLSFQVTWQAGSSSQHSQFSMNNGVVKSYRLGIQVLSAPAKGVKGSVRIEPYPDGNVEGGELEVTWCE